jgi:hypothetical protein
MPCLYVDALAIAVRSRPRLRLAAELPVRNQHRRMAVVIARARGIPLERIYVRQPVPGSAAEAADYAITWRALDALGPPDHEQTLFLVRSDLVLDLMSAPLASTVHAVGWSGDDVGITHLEEQGGTKVFGLLDWAVAEDRGATVVIVDDPAYVDVQAKKPAFAAVAVRLARTGGLRVVASGETSPGVPAMPEQARHARVFSGTDACGAWLDLHAALSSGMVSQGELVLLRTTGDERQGWLLLEASLPRELRITRAPLEE